MRYDSIRVLLAIVAAEDLELAQFDVQTAFLHGQLDEEIYMEIPEGLAVEETSERTGKNVVCRLRKSLYGLKQAPRCWNIKFSAFLKEFRFKESEADKCIFVGSVDECTVYLALFVDDGLIAAKSQAVLESVIEHLSNAFKITIGDSSMFVGMQIERDRKRKSIFVHQSAYVKRVLNKFRMSDAKPGCIPSDPHSVLCPMSKEEIKNESVPCAVGSLMFLAIVSRPDIAYSVSSVSRYLNNHNDDH